MGRKITLWIFQATNKRNIPRKNMDMAMKGKPKGRNPISSDNSTEQRHKNLLCQSKNRRRNKIADVVYVVIEMKRSLT